MNKSLKALLMGYVLFRAAGKYFATYNAAMAYGKSVPTCDSMSVEGYSIRCRCWIGFYYREMFKYYPPVPVTTYNPGKFPTSP